MWWPKRVSWCVTTTDQLCLLSYLMHPESQMIQSKEWLQIGPVPGAKVNTLGHCTMSRHCQVKISVFHVVPTASGSPLPTTPPITVTRRKLSHFIYNLH